MKPTTPSSHQALGPEANKDRELRYWSSYEVQNPDGSWTTIAHILRADRESLKQSLVAEMPKKLGVAVFENIDGDIFNSGFNAAVDDMNQAITKVFNGRM